MMKAGMEFRSVARKITTAVAVSSLATGCHKEAPGTPADTASATAEASTSAPPIPGVGALEPVGRAELLVAAGAAADQTAAGNALPASNLPLKNRSFELRLPFGCRGTTVGNWGEWRLDPGTRVLRVSFRPQNWGSDPSFRAAANGTAYDAAEGFWIERPWTRSEDCPAEAGAGASPPPAATPEGGPASLSQAAMPEPQTLALVQYFSPEAPRTMRRGNRPYTFTAKQPADDASPDRAFRARVTGRIVGFGDGQPVHCVTRAPARQPLCIVAVEFTKVILEDAATGETLEEWRG
jgi:hypothetical protein